MALQLAVVKGRTRKQGQLCFFLLFFLFSFVNGSVRVIFPVRFHFPLDSEANCYTIFPCVSLGIYVHIAVLLVMWNTFSIVLFGHNSCSFSKKFQASRH